MPSIAADAKSSIDPEHLIEAVRDLLGAGRLAAAKPLLAALERLIPGSAELAALEGTCAMVEGRTPEALDHLGDLIEADHSSARALLTRAGVFFRAGDLSRALGDAADAVIAAPDNASAKALLGLLLIEKGDAERARICLTDALDVSPDDPTIRLGLAEAALRTGEKELARTTLEEGVARAPGRADLRRAAVRVAFASGHVADSAALAETARREGVVDPLLLRMQARAEMEMNRKSAALEHLKMALDLAPNDPPLRAEAVAAGLARPFEQIPLAVTTRRFDAFADGYDRAMIAASDRVPGLIRAAIIAHCDPGFEPRRRSVLDLGCGTGLVAIATSDLVLGPWTGVDLASRMLARARATGLYSELVEADFIAYLIAADRLFSLIIAADVLCAFSSLTDVFSAVAKRLAPDGRFILSLEMTCDEPASDAPWSLGATGRYRHSRRGLEEAARSAGLSVLSVAPETLREEDAHAVLGLIAVLARASDAR